jgi:hypothetical protein
MVENYRPGVLAKLGLGFTDLAVDHRGLVYCSISGFCQTGGNASLGACDVVIQAMSGLMSVTGTADGELVKSGVCPANNCLRRAYLPDRATPAWFPQAPEFVAVRGPGRGGSPPAPLPSARRGNETRTDPGGLEGNRPDAVAGSRYWLHQPVVVQSDQGLAHRRLAYSPGIGDGGGCRLAPQRIRPSRGREHPPVLSTPLQRSPGGARCPASRSGS